MAKALPEQAVAAFLEARTAAGSPPVVAHDLYLTNLACPDEGIRQRSLDTLVEELGRCAALGLDGLVCHVGAHLGLGEEKGLARYSAGIAEVLARTEGNPVAILLETTAGQGSCLGHRFEHLAEVIASNGGVPRLGVCLDTCHVFAAGYDLRAEAAYRETWDEFERVVGLERLRAIHVNDSRRELGSRVDRHTHIGDGEIGEAGFRLLVNDRRLARVPMMIETPEHETMHRVNLERLKAMRRPYQTVTTIRRAGGRSRCSQR